MSKPVELNYLAENLRLYRKLKGISQDELAHLCRLHRTYVGGLERAERNLTVSTLAAISLGTGISVPDLLRNPN